MPETQSAVQQVGWAWAPLAVALLALAAWAAAGMVAALATGNRRGAWSGPLRATARLVAQPSRTTPQADVLLRRAGVVGMVLLPVLMLAVVPLGHWVMGDLRVGIVWFNALDVGVWAMVWLTGWGPNAAYSLVGGYRFLAQGLAYELPLMFALTAPAVLAGSLRVGDVVAAQQGLWFVVWAPAAFLVYCVGVAAFSLVGPFASALGDDIAGGATSELCGADALLFRAGRYLLLAVGAGFGVALFLGGGAGPLLPAWGWTAVKTLVLLAALAWVAPRLPLLRADKLMEVGWVVLLPLALAQVLVVAVVAAVRGVS